MSRLLAHGCWSRYFGARCCPYLHRWDSFLVNPSLRFSLFLAAGPFPRLDHGSHVFLCPPETVHCVQQHFPKGCTHHDQVFFSSFSILFTFCCKIFTFFSSKLQISLLPTSTFWMQTQCKALLPLDKTQNTAPPLTTNNQLAHILLQDSTVILVQINGVIAGQSSRP